MKQLPPPPRSYNEPMIPWNLDHLIRAFKAAKLIARTPEYARAELFRLLLDPVQKRVGDYRVKLSKKRWYVECNTGVPVSSYGPLRCVLLGAILWRVCRVRASLWISLVATILLFCIFAASWLCLSRPPETHNPVSQEAAKPADRQETVSRPTAATTKVQETFPVSEKAPPHAYEGSAAQLFGALVKASGKSPTPPVIWSNDRQKRKGRDRMCATAICVAQQHGNSTLVLTQLCREICA